MAAVSSKNKLKMGSAGRYYGTYLIYDVANSYLTALHAKIPPVAVTQTNPPVHVQNPRKSILYRLLFTKMFIHLLKRIIRKCDVCSFNVFKFMHKKHLRDKIRS